MGVNISVGDAKVDYSTYGYTVWTDAVVAVGITTADPSNPRIDRIVGYVDLSVVPDSANANNPGILKFMAIAGTPAASPSAPSDVTVQASVGASNPYFNIASVLVGTGVTTIDDTKITDTRVFVTIPSNSIPDGSVTNAKVATGIDGVKLSAGTVPNTALSTSAILLGYAQITSPVTATTLATTGLTVTVAVPAGGRKVKVTAWADSMQNSNAGAYVQLFIFDGTISGTQLAKSTILSASAGQPLSATVISVTTPAAGNKTYTVGLASAGGGTASLNVGATSPAFILVELI